MSRFLIALAACALAVGLVGLLQTEPTQAQQGGPPVCVTLPAGEHAFTAPSRDREGDVTFRVTVGEGGVVTDFTEPGGQSIPPSAMLQLFTGDDAYPLPEGVSIIECGGGGATAAMEDAVCLNLPAGIHTGTVSASGRSYDITMDVGGGGVLRGVQLLGESYTAQEALGLLEGFGASLPRGVNIVDCPPSAGGTGGSAGQTLYANTGTGGLADQGGSVVLWYAVGGALAAVVAGMAGVALRRGRSRV